MKAKRRPFHDEYIENGESAVFVDGRILVLSELATSILALMGDDLVDVSLVAEGLLEAYGPPGDGVDLEAATSAAMQNLAAEGLVEVKT
ncbi:MAG: hypothetical protein ACRDPJ_07260 [Nocardioidaceae bacterium]